MKNNLLKPIGHIDVPDKVQIDADGTVLILGWCLISDSEPPLKGEIFVNDQRMSEVAFGEPRPDVHEVYPQYKWGRQSGFSARFPIESYRGRCRIGVRVYTASESSHYLDKRVELDDPLEDKVTQNLALMAFINNHIHFNYFPLQAYVEVTTACNLSCIMCRGEGAGKKDVSPNLFLDMNLFLKLRPMFPYLAKMNLCGWGEPTLHKQYSEFIRMVREDNPGCQINLTSNFNRVTDELIEALIDYKVSLINISIDGATAAVYEKIRVKGSFEKVLDNIRRFENRKREKGSKLPKLSYEFVIQKDNVHELPAYMELIRSLGGKAVTLEHVCGAAHLEIDYLAHLATFDAAMKMAKEMGISINGAGYQHFLNAKAQENRQVKLSAREAHAAPMNVSMNKIPPGRPKEIACFEPFQTVYINPDGRVTPCCLSSLTLGNLYENSFEEIWFSYKYNMFRKEMIEQNYDECCTTCISLLKGIQRIPVAPQDIKAVIKQVVIENNPSKKYYLKSSIRNWMSYTKQRVLHFFE